MENNTTKIKDTERAVFQTPEANGQTVSSKTEKEPEKDGAQTERRKKNYISTALIMVFSVVCSFLLWVYVTDTEGEEITLPYTGVAVRYDGETAMRESRGLIVSYANPSSVSVSLTANRRVLSSINSADLSVSVDLSTINRSGTYYLAPRVVYPNRVDTNSVTARISPSNIYMDVEELSKKTIPVVGVFNGNPTEGYAADPIQFSPSSVIIRGPESVLAQVENAYVEINRKDVDKTLDYDTIYELRTATGETVSDEDITLDTETVHVTLPIRAVKEVALVLELIPGGGAAESNVEWQLEPSSITLTGDPGRLEGINSIVVKRLDLSKVTDDTYTDTYPIVIPNDTVNTSGVTETTLRLELRGLKEKAFAVSKLNISATNVSEGYSCEILNESIENVIIRGPEEALARVEDLNIRAIANLEGYGEATGVYTVPVRIEIDGNTEVGAIGEYSVYVRITVKEAEAEGNG